MSKSIRFGDSELRAGFGGLGGGVVDNDDVDDNGSLTKGTFLGVGDFDVCALSSMGKSSGLLLFLGVSLLSNHFPVVIDCDC